MTYFLSINTPLISLVLLSLLYTANSGRIYGEVELNQPVKAEEEYALTVGGDGKIQEIPVSAPVDLSPRPQIFDSSEDNSSES